METHDDFKKKPYYQAELLMMSVVYEIERIMNKKNIKREFIENKFKIKLNPDKDLSIRKLAMIMCYLEKEVTFKFNSLDVDKN